jgi:hypothetical protein
MEIYIPQGIFSNFKLTPTKINIHVYFVQQISFGAKLGYLLIAL